MRSVDPAYRMHFEDGDSIDFYSKKELVTFLEENQGQLKPVKEIKWYKGCGCWSDMTKNYKKYLKK